MIGIDLVDLKKVRLNEAFLAYILTEDERREYDRFQSEKGRREYAGGRFAAKEAIFKATQDRNYLKYSILNDADGRPYVKDHPEIDLSISHDGSMAAAVALKNEVNKR